MDDFSDRNAVQAITVDGKVLFFGGQDSQDGKQYNHVHLYDPAEKTINRIHFKEGKQNPAKRNSHTFVKAGEKAYVACGANDDGPLKDIYEVNLENFEFSKLVLDEADMLFPATEMHTCHLYRNNELLILGGRQQPAGTTSHTDIIFTDDIISVNLDTKKVSLFGKLPTALGAHISALIDDKYILVYGGTNGFRFFDSLLRYEIETQKWTLMTKYPSSFGGTTFF